MTTQQTRDLTAVIEMGHEAPMPDALRSLSFEEADDPTIAKKSAPPHEPLRAARKAADHAEHLARKNKHDEAVAKYREAVALDPLYYEAANNLALELEAFGKTAEAETTFRHLIESAPEHVLAFTNLATLLCAAHRYAEAEAVLRSAMKLHSYSFKANYLLGTVLFYEGKRTGEAKTKLEYAEVKYPQAKALLDQWPAKAAN